MKIGIMGGTFDPIHNGHLMLGKAALEQFLLDEVWFMPNGNPPHKKSSAIQSDVKRRAEMTELAIKDYPYFRLELYEAKKESISYSWETLEFFTKTRTEDDFYFIVGADSLFAIETWARPERIFAVCTILAAYRNNIDTPCKMQMQIEYLREKYRAKIQLLEAPLMKISSHELRKMLTAGESVSGFLPERVEKYIKKEGLYGAEDK